jgi:hypothetical protein
MYTLPPELIRYILRYEGSWKYFSETHRLVYLKKLYALPKILSVNHRDTEIPCSFVVLKDPQKPFLMMRFYGIHFSFIDIVERKNGHLLVVKDTCVKHRFSSCDMQSWFVKYDNFHICLKTLFSDYLGIDSFVF